ncbi:MAG: PepSY domain-containing protein [Nitrospira sp.]|nr:PepSY domain-containing protein [Nitrospira sp.]
MMDNKMGLVATVVIGIGLIVGGMVWSGEKDRHRGDDAQEVIAMSMNAKVTIEQAMATALENFPGKVIEAELEQKQDKAIWEVEVVTAEQGIMKIDVDAESGSVIMTGEKMVHKKVAVEKKL